MTSHIKLSSPATREFWEIPVLYEDEHLLALDKPGGLLTSACCAKAGAVRVRVAKAKSHVFFMA